MTAEPAGVRVIGPRRGLSFEIGELIEYRELLYSFVWRDVKVRYKQTVIGIGWAVVQPLFTMILFSLFFGTLAKIPSDGLPTPIFYYTALVPWVYFANSLSASTVSLVQHRFLITKVYFPRLSLPISSVLSGLVDFSIAFLILIGMMFYFDIVPTLAIFTFPLFLLLTIMTALAVGIWFSALNAIFRDVRYAAPFIIQLWLFASPVAYPSSLVPDRWRVLYDLNPMAPAIEGFRWSLAGSGEFPGPILIVSFATVTALLFMGLVFFRRVESHVEDVV